MGAEAWRPKLVIVAICAAAISATVREELPDVLFLDADSECVDYESSSPPSPGCPKTHAVQSLLWDDPASWLQRRARSLLNRSIAASAGRELQHGVDLGGAFCDTHTGGTCYLLGCKGSRGETQCLSHECRCIPGFCVVGGVCFANSPFLNRGCPRNTGGACMTGVCYSYRGPTQCENGQCLCRPGYCSGDDGICRLDRGVFFAEVAQVNDRHPLFPGSHGHVSSALCFSGGGSRSLSLTMGALRALENLGLMRNVDAISSVSGGTWASAVYMFAKTCTAQLLGAATYPSELTMEYLRQRRSDLGAAATTNVVSIAEGIYMSTPSSDLWIKAYSHAILEPFGLESTDKYMAADTESVQRIVRANPQLNASMFLTPRVDRPKTFVMSGVILAPEGHDATSNNVVSLQMSPDYTGSPFYPNLWKVDYPPRHTHVHYDPPLANKIVGGGFVETFAFGGQAPAQQSGGVAVKLDAAPDPFSLAKAVGISSAAFATTMSDFPLFKDHAEHIIPKGNVWPVTSDEFPGPQAAMRYQLGDGGNIENSGLLAMLQRGARRVVWFLNTDMEIISSAKYSFCGGTSHWSTETSFTGFASNQLYDKFGFYHDSSSRQSEFLGHNKVFDSDGIFDILCGLQKLRDTGKPAVLRTSLEVKQNTWWGILGGFNVDLILVYNERCSDFEGLLPQETQLQLKNGNSGPFAYFPFFHTTLQNRGRFTSYTHEQVNLLAAQAEYSVLQNAELFRQFLR